MKKITREELDQILQQHRTWLENYNIPPQGERGKSADLHNADLRNTDLSKVNIKYANLQGANLGGANLSHTILQYTNLRGANLCGANLCGADLYRANLICADLIGADLSGADIWEVDLRHARFDINIRDCLSFSYTKFTPEALPWLILHPRWADLKDTVQIESE